MDCVSLEDADRLGPSFGEDEVGFVWRQAEHIANVRMTEVNPIYSICKFARQTDTLSVADYRMALRVSHRDGNTNPRSGDAGAMPL